MIFVVFKQKTAYEMRISDWSSDVCSSDLLLGQIVIDDDGMGTVVAEELAHGAARVGRQELQRRRLRRGRGHHDRVLERTLVFQDLHELGDAGALLADGDVDAVELLRLVVALVDRLLIDDGVERDGGLARSEEHTSELQSLMRISYAVFCLKKQNKK